MTFRRARGDGPDVILVDTAWFPADFLAYQLASRGARVHAFTPSLRWPPYLRAAHPYLSYLEAPIGNQKSDSFAAMVERVEPACIIPCTEHALYWLWKQPEHIQERCLPNAAPAIRPLLLDRGVLVEAAAGWGVTTPAAMPLESQDDCGAAIAAGLPLVVKSGQSIGGDGVALCRTSGDVIRAFGEFSGKAASVTAQRYYVGPTYLAGGLFLHGEAAHFYAGEKTIMSPPLTGRAFELRSAGEPHFSALLQSAETVCKNLDWTGLASFDFVLDQDGQFRFVDFNPRAWGSVDATLTAGVDLFGGIDRWIRYGNAGIPTRSVPGISHRVFPAYTLEPSGTSLWRRLKGLRDAPRGALPLAIGELAREVDQRVRRAIRTSAPATAAEPRTSSASARSLARHPSALPCADCHECALPVPVGPVAGRCKVWFPCREAAPVGGLTAILAIAVGRLGRVHLMPVYRTPRGSLLLPA